MRFVQAIFGGLVIMLIISSCDDNLEEEPKVSNGPNILMIVTDDQRYDALGVTQQEIGSGRFPWFPTPHLDALSKTGVRFKNAFVVNSLCSPSRATILTGNYPHITGNINNQRPLIAESFVSHLNNNGYHTAHFGKWHMGEQVERPGFAHSYTFIGQGDYVDALMLENGKEKRSDGWVDNVTTEYLIDYIKKYSDVRPFCFYLGFKTPHGPWNYLPPGKEDLFNDQYIRNAPNLYHKPAYLDTGQFFHDAKGYKGNVWKDKRAMVFLSQIDENVGRIVQALKDQGKYENTVIIFLSDNGFYFGEHGLRDKRSAYEESMRIPLIIAGPGIPPGVVSDDLVLNLDIAPTIIDLAGQKNDKMQGRSLLDLLSYSYPNDLPVSKVVDQDWRKSFLYTYFKERTVEPQVDIYAVRNETHKLIQYIGHPEWNELFDLTNDPFEIENLYNKPGYSDLQLKLHAEFNRLANEIDLTVSD
jgi:arylsulfatase A-like enzyme